MNSEEMSNRFLDYAAAIISLSKRLGTNYQVKHISNQLLRSATSCGANYEEARAAESKSDFSHKLQIVLKELRESRFWIRLIKRANLLRDVDILPILNETNELIKIIAKSVITSKINEII